MNNKSKIILIILVVVVVVVGAVFWVGNSSNPADNTTDGSDTVNNIGDATSTEDPGAVETVPDFEVIAENLEIPWDIAFLPEGDMLVTERPGQLLRVDESGNKIPVEVGESESVPEVAHVGEGGLLGIVLHPDFEQNRIIYLYHTTRSDSGSGYMNRVEQYKFVDDTLVRDSDTQTVITGIPGARYHDGGRLEFGPDEKLYITVGDATNEDWAQISQSEGPEELAGSILRLNPDGSIPGDNPFGNVVWSYGHRNPQGITWDDQGRLWSTEHGRSGRLSGLDEVNLIGPGQNYGWPDSEGDTVLSGTVAPKVHSGADTTWAPASASYWDGSVFFGGLGGVSLYEAVINNEEEDPTISEVKSHYKGEFGRIRTVTLGPDGMFYITTSNRDGRGDVSPGDDKIVRINPNQFRADQAEAVETFRDELVSRATEKLGQPIEGFTAFMLLEAFPGLQPVDFDGVESFEGVYAYEDGELNHVRSGELPRTSAATTVSSQGYQTLLDNVSGRLGISVETSGSAVGLVDTLEQ